MDVAGRVVAVTGAGSGIGAALANAFHSAGAAGLALLDLDAAAAERTAQSLSAMALGVDVSNEAALVAAIQRVEQALGPIEHVLSQRRGGFRRRARRAGHLSGERAVGKILVHQRHVPGIRRPCAAAGHDRPG